MWGADKLTKFQNRSLEYQCTNIKFDENDRHLLKLSSRNRATDMLWSYNSVNSSENLLICIPQAYLYNINAHTTFGENRLTFTQVIVSKRTYGRVAGWWLCQKFSKCAYYQSQIISVIISRHIPSLGKSINIYSSYYQETEIRTNV